MVRIDNIDVNILKFLRINSRTHASQISEDLAKNGTIITSRSVLNRIKRLEKYGIIQSYTTTLNPRLFAKKENVIVLLKFVSYSNNADIEKLSSYLCDSPFCFFAAKMIGGANGYDYTCHLVFDTKQEFDVQFKSILNTFSDLIAHSQVYKSKIIKEIPRALPSTRKLEGVRTMNSLNRWPIDDPAYIQKLMSQSMDDSVRDILAQFGQF
ncbi:MAG TPA: Lrp/AsnC family transcriptional regulator [Nitrososphaeraceae archaeon]|nr:Lrp/AsnC family transcriptional regulator [Nitrososphaeraceae archaeon]